MKKYKEYMDTIKASDTLHQRLVGLETAGKRPIPWKKYGSLAAALVLVCGLGAWGLSQGGWEALQAKFQSPLMMGSTPEIADALQPDIAPEDPDAACDPAEKTIGGYEVVSGSGPNAMVSYYVLPCIEYGVPKEQVQMSLDWDIAKGAIRRELSQDEIITLMGGKDAVDAHLDWGEYELTGWGAWYEDGSFWGAYLQGYEGPLDHFEFAVTANQLPPTCIAFAESVTQEIRGLTVTADGYDSVATPQGGVDASTRRVSFMKDDYGYRFDITGVSRALTEERVSRLVARVAGEGLGLYSVDGTADVCQPEDGTYVCAYCGHVFPVGSAHGHPFIGADATYTCDICGNTFPVGTVHNDPDVGPASTEPYDPNEAADPSYNAPVQPDGESPRDRGENWCGTPDADPNDGMCTGLPVPYTCPDCGVIYASGTEHHCAGETHTCPICGEVLPIDMEHSHLPPDPAESQEVCGLPLAPPDAAADTIAD